MAIQGLQAQAIRTGLILMYNGKAVYTFYASSVYSAEFLSIRRSSTDLDNPPKVVI